MFQKGKTTMVNNIPINLSCLCSALQNKRYTQHNNATISHILFPLWEKSGKSVEYIMPYITYEDGYVEDFQTIIQNDKLFENSFEN